MTMIHLQIHRFIKQNSCFATGVVRCLSRWISVEEATDVGASVLEMSQMSVVRFTRYRLPLGRLINGETSGWPITSLKKKRSILAFAYCLEQWLSRSARHEYYIRNRACVRLANLIRYARVKRYRTLFEDELFVNCSRNCALC
jgi:hypothetical protein